MKKVSDASDFIFVCRIISLHIYRHKCGQTSRPVVEAEIQNRCNFKACLCSCDLFLVKCYFSNIYVLAFEFPCRFNCSYNFGEAFCSYRSLFL